MVTDDGLLHPLLGVPRRLGNSDLAIVQFRSAIEYKIAPFTLEPGAMSEPVLAVGFPAGAEVGALAVTRASFRCCYPNLCLNVIAWAIQMRLKSVRVAARFLMPKVSWLGLTVGASIEIQILASMLLKMEVNQQRNYWRKWLNPVGEFRSVYICSSPRFI
ncbi:MULTISPECIES: hypothetical protein [unclassified Microcoleus]|uniref:hypothetical protein n=1 Tax=unclassified Microcoleus TaxID=2642155 RepID=UPI002FD47789